MSILSDSQNAEVGSPTSMDPTLDYPLYVGEDCPIQWPVAQTRNINKTYPFHGVDPEAQPLDEFAYRKYLDTLWMPEMVFPLQGFIQELQRAFTHLTNASIDGSIASLYGLLKPFMLSAKQITKKYAETIPGFLSERATDPQDEEERMILYAAKLEKARPSESSSSLGIDEKRWLARFRRREAQIQLLMRLLLLSYPDEIPGSPAKRKRGRNTRSSIEESLEKLLGLMTAWIALEEPDPNMSNTVDDGGWAGRFCETIIAPLFKQKLSGEYDMCIFSLCPTKYNTPPSSDAGSPIQQHTALVPTESAPFDLSRDSTPSGLIDGGPDVPSRGISPFPDAGTSNLQERSRSRSLSRTRSASIFSLGGHDGDEVNGLGKPSINVNRGGLGTGKAIFREIEMRKSAKDIKERKPVPKPKPKPKPKKSDQALAKRSFGRSATAPLKQSKSIEQNVPQLLVAETPMGKRFRTTSPDLDMDGGVEDSPDALLLQGVSDTPSYQGNQKVFIPETPLKR